MFSTWSGITFIIYIFPKNNPRKKVFKRVIFGQMTLFAAASTKLNYISVLRKKIQDVFSGKFEQ